MFNIEDTDTIMKLINIREADELIIPIYIRIGKDAFSLIDVDEIQNCSASIFKVGFGSSNSVFIRNKFPKNKLIDFTNPKIFGYFDDDKQCAIDYYVFESDIIENDDSILTKEINKWNNILFEYVMDHVEKNKKERIKRIMEELS